MRKDIFGIAKQADWDTAVTVMEYYPPVATVDPDPQREILEEEETTGTRAPEGIEYGVEFFNLAVAGPARLDSIVRELSGVFGLPTTTTPDLTNAPTARNHLFSPLAAGKKPQLHSMFVARVDPDPDIVDLFYNARGNELVLAVETNGFLRREINWVAAKLDDTQVAPSPTRDVSKRFQFRDSKAHISVDGGAEAEIKVGNFSLSYANTLDTDDSVLGSNLLQSLEEGNIAAEVSFEVREALNAHYRRALQDTPAKVKIRLEALGATIGGAIAEKLEVIVYACEYITAPAALSAADRLRGVPVTARAKLDSTTGKIVEANVVNAVDAY